MNRFPMLIAFLSSVFMAACGKDIETSLAQPIVHAGPVMLYSGTGASADDAAAIAGVLDEHDVEYQPVTAAQVNAMSLADLLKFGTFIWPGGLGGKVTKALEPQVRSLIRKAVVEHGVSYVGFCAGAFLAVNSPPDSGGHPEYGFSLVPNNGLLKEYFPNGAQSFDPMTVSVTLPGGQKQDMVFYGGPYFPDAAEPLARYKDGAPAMMQTVVGAGFVVLSGPHPESPSAWVSSNDSDGIESDRELAWRLIDAAIRRDRLPTI